MRWFSMILFCLIISTTIGDPDPKKYKKEPNDKIKKSESLTDDEKKFLREVEEKFAIKSNVSDKVEEKSIDKENKTHMENVKQKAAFPAVIAIEIVNDTEKSKGKRTIDANLGYGYRTNDGYSYTYFGKSNLDQGKFMIYPYSQEDLPAVQNLQHNTEHSSQSSGKYSSSKTYNVEITPSQAYELVPVKDEQPSYQYNKPAIPFETGYQNVQNFGSPTVNSHSAKPAKTLYTTYNGQEFSGLSGQFPSVMSDYFVNPSQLLNNPQYQSAGLTEDHLRSQSSYLNQNKPIVPVLVLRIPSSYLNNPRAELYADLPKNYPLSQYLNHVNLQGLVNQYFKNHGYSSAPQIMSYQKPEVSTPEVEPQHYSNPHVRPSYTQDDFSGIQYSGVKPVMAKYPNTYQDQQYSVPKPQSLYQRPVQQQQYEYQYIPQTEVNMQSYYIQPQYQQSTRVEDDTGYQNGQPETNDQESYPVVSYQTQTSNEDSKPVLEGGYEAQNAPQGNAESAVEQYAPVNQEASIYANQESDEHYKKSVASEQGSQSDSGYSSQGYYQSAQSPRNSVSVFPSRLIHTEQYEELEQTSIPQNYEYKTQNNKESSKTLVLSENYPSKDHTIATVLPYAYKTAKQPTQSSIQTVSYVTPVPSAKYQSKYRIMVPQTILKNPNDEKVSYVNSHSLPMHYTQVGHYTDVRAQSDYGNSGRYVSSISNQPSYSRNVHSHPKRMVKQEKSQEASDTNKTDKKQNERNIKKQSK
ncbi:uncharacterized protein LOC116770990 [Danaus plexippus]|uniref:uncharacterized protein LOC116770990 n=1 Tax=Danaus plexippus TaxID=13037 RepID=UPI002AB06CFA|nr:uncharacterized protein LOC116770990 [Danaus plexippus]